MKKGKHWRARWRGAVLTLTDHAYDTAMCHVERMRWSADQDNAYEKREEGDEDWIDSRAWKLSDTLEEALSVGTLRLGKRQTRQKRILAGLEALSEECDLAVSEPCRDDDADDVFAIE